MGLFERVRSKKETDPNLHFTVEVSYIEVGFDILFQRSADSGDGNRFTTRKCGTYSTLKILAISGFVSIPVWVPTLRISANLSLEVTKR